MLLAKATDKPVSVQDLKSHPTVRDLETFFAGQMAAETYETQADYPLTQTQNGILVECISHPGSTFYNIPALFKLSEKIDT